jgi:hypothetical protein
MPFQKPLYPYDSSEDMSKNSNSSVKHYRCEKSKITYGVRSDHLARSSPLSWQP